MNNSEILKELNSLLHLDLEATRAYEQAREKIDEKDIHNQFRRFRDDHSRHCETLSRQIEKLSGKPPEPEKDFKGKRIQGFIPLTDISGGEEVVKTMYTNEQLTNRLYADALTKDLPSDIKSLIDKNFADEQRHLSYIEALLELAPVPE